MARGGRKAEDDDAWRPSREDALEEYEDEFLEEAGAEQEPRAAKPKAAASRRRPRRGGAGCEPADREREGEALAGKDMLGRQRLDGLPGERPGKTAAAARTSARKRPVGRPAHQADNEPKDEEPEEETEEEAQEESAYEDSEDEESEEASESESESKSEESRYEVSEDEETAAAKRLPLRKARKQPAKRSAGRAEQPSSKPAKSAVACPEQPVHRLTTANNKKPPQFLVKGQKDSAPFTFTAYRGEGMVMLAMNWKESTPPDDFVGWVIEYTEPQSSKWCPILNYCTFPGQAAAGSGHEADGYSSRLSPIQRFRWIHAPCNIEKPGYFRYRVTPAFMPGGCDGDHSLSYGEAQELKIELIAETLPGEMNVAFTRGFVSSTAFLTQHGAEGVGDILPAKADEGLDFKPKDTALQEKALSWMGFEARQVLLGALDAAIADPTAEVRMLAYDLNEPDIVGRLQRLGPRVKIIIDDSAPHAAPDDAESRAAALLERTAGKGRVQRQHVGGLQHNKVLVVDGARAQIAIGGSTNFSWRGLYVQHNNMVALQGRRPVAVFRSAFDHYWDHPNDTDGFYKTESAQWQDLGLSIDAQVTFSPHCSKAGTLDGIAADIDAVESSLFYSLAFLYQTPGVILEAIQKKAAQKGIMVYGLSDKSVAGLDVRHNGNPPVAYPSAAAAAVADGPASSSSNDGGGSGCGAGGAGARMHHKFVVLDFDRPAAARVYTGSHNFSAAADTRNGEHLFRVRGDARVATAYMVEAVAMFDHYEVRAARSAAARAPAHGAVVHLRLPPGGGEAPWWEVYWSDATKIQDREMFGGEKGSRR